jgi:hypothetical protein
MKLDLPPALVESLIIRERAFNAALVSLAATIDGMWDEHRPAVGDVVYPPAWSIHSDGDGIDPFPAIRIADRRRPGECSPLNPALFNHRPISVGEPFLVSGFDPRSDAPSGRCEQHQPARDSNPGADHANITVSWIARSASI